MLQLPRWMTTMKISLINRFGAEGEGRAAAGGASYTVAVLEAWERMGF